MLFDLDDSEQRIERMLAKGHAIMREALDTYKPVAIIACYSSGNDSIVSTHFAATNYSAKVGMVNTRIGVQKSIQHAITTCAKLGWDMEMKFADPEGKPKKKKDGSPWDEKRLLSGRWTDGETAYEEAVLNFGFPGKSQHSRMYIRLKERSFNAFKRDAKVGHSRNDNVMFVSGVRADESVIRAGYKTAIQKNQSAVWVNPFYYATAADFALYREEYGLPINPVSKQIGISGECLCGAFAKPGEKELIRQIEPETVDYIESLESRCKELGLPCRWGESPVKERDLAGQTLLFQDLYGETSDFMPACVGCIRRQIINAI